jgi:hypothetical protein
VEIELQFVYNGCRPLVVPTTLADLELARSRTGVLLDTYFDTPSLDLRRAGCSLRVRQSEHVVHALLTLKGPSRRNGGAKRRHETELAIESLPADAEEMCRLLGDMGLDHVVRRLAGLGAGFSPQPIGQLRNRRSQHRYEHGLHSLELTWDELEFPTGAPQIRLEVEARSRLDERLLKQAAAELRELLGDRLVAPERGKTRELCERLYPELLAA